MSEKEKQFIFLVDMNSFFVSCELIRKPEYKKQALVIASRGKRSVISAASYKAKELGIDSATNLQTALMRYPDLIVVEPDFEYYRSCSKKIMHFLTNFSESIRVSSIDEAFIDVTHYFKDTPATPENIMKLAKHIQGTLLKTLGFPCNIGISTNKFLAKMASDLRKPFAIETLFVPEIPEKLWPLPIGKMHGIGKKSAEVLRYIHIKTIGEFAEFPNEKLLTSLLGSHIIRQQQMAQGVYHDTDEEVVEREHKISISQSRTFLEDVRDLAIIERKLLELWKNIEDELTSKQQKFRTIRVFYKRSDFNTLQRSHTLQDYTNDFPRMFKEAMQLFTSLWEGEDVRLVGIGVADFMQVQEHMEQLNLFQLDETNMKKRMQEERKNAVLAQVAESYPLMSGADFARKHAKLQEEAQQDEN